MDVDLIAAAAPRSDQINADDLIGGPQIVTITEVRKGNSEQPVEIVTAEFGPGRPYRPGKSMTRVLLEVWGPKSGTYVGRRLKLYRDPEITFGPSKVGGIRISHMTDLDKAKAIPLTKTRGKKELFRVEPLPSGLQIISAEEADEIAAAIEKAADRAELNAIGAQLKAFDLADHRGRLQGLWKSRLSELESAPNLGAKPEPDQGTAPTLRDRLVAALVSEGKAEEPEQVGYLSGEFKRPITTLDDLTDAEALEITEFLEGAQNQAHQ